MKQPILSIVTSMLLSSFSAAFANTTLPDIVKNGTSSYKIVIGANSSEAEQDAARELAGFLKEATGVSLEIITDEHPSEGPEIVLGRTNRLDASTLPAELQPLTGDGYTYFVDSGRIHILGRNPRGTLYGVYDWLEDNLGVRFLAPDINHVPARSALPVSGKSFRHDPPMEYRDICTFQDETWGVRNRLNSRWGHILREKALGGIRWVGPVIHTSSKYISPNEYFESHPEYFAMINGKRTSKILSSNQPAQLCLSNPEVYEILSKKIKSHLDAYRTSKNYNPTSKALVELTINDGMKGSCECPECAAVNREEETEGGTLFRTLNRLSDDFAKDYPEVSFQTLAYAYAQKAPVKIVLRDNVIICFAPLKADQGRLITDASSEANRKVLQDLKSWDGKCKQLYLWNYYYNSWSWIDLFPDTQTLTENLRLYRQHGVKGLFAEASYTPASELRELRYYLLAQALWKHDIDEKALTREFCELYYGDGAEDMLEYLQFSRDYFLSLAPTPLLCQDKLPYSDSFLKEANAILERAEQAASTEETKFRIAVARLPVWYQILQRQFEGTGKIAELPDEWNFRHDPDNQGLTDQWQKSKDFAGWKKIPTGSWISQGYPHGIAWYANTLEIPEDIPENAPLALYFGAVDGTCDVWLDGEKIGEQKLSPTLMWNKGFPIKLPQPVKPGLHQLVLRVEKDFSAAGITDPVSLVDLSRNVPEEIRVIGRRFMEVAKKGGLKTINDGWRKRDQLEEDLFPKIRALLKEKSSDEEIDPRVLRRNAAMLPNTHKTWQIVNDPDSLSGACVIQKNDRKWTIGQGVGWRIDKELAEKGAVPGSRYKLRVRVKLNADDPKGIAFSFGSIFYENADWKGTIDERHVHCRDLKPNEWQWVDYPGVVELKEAVNGNNVFVAAAQNPAIDSIAIDAFELSPEIMKHE